MLCNSSLPLQFWGSHTPTATNKGGTPYELFYKMKPDVEHICTFGSMVKVILPGGDGLLAGLQV